MRLIFMGYSDIGHICLKVLIDLCRQFHDDIVAVVTHEDNPREQIWFKSVKDLAEDHNLRSIPRQTPMNRLSWSCCGVWLQIFSFPVITG